jgi:serine/threonine protein kinase
MGRILGQEPQKPHRRTLVRFTERNYSIQALTLEDNDSESLKTALEQSGTRSVSKVKASFFKAILLRALSSTGYNSDLLDNDSERFLAVKKLRSKEALQCEANNLWHLDRYENATKHKVTMTEAFVIDNTKFYLITEPFANGGDLGYLLGGVACSPEFRRKHEEESFRTLKQAMGCLAAGLASLHEHGFRHRDLHPGNILIHNGEVKYCDFGVSLHFDHDQLATTDTRNPPRMNRYAAPEVISTRGKHNFKTEVFSLGAVLYEIWQAIYHSDLLAESLEEGHFRYESRCEESRARWSGQMKEYTMKSHDERYSFKPTQLDKSFESLASMLAQLQHYRPSSEEVAREICLLQGAWGSDEDKFICGRCEEGFHATVNDLRRIREAEAQRSREEAEARRTQRPDIHGLRKVKSSEAPQRPNWI